MLVLHVSSALLFYTSGVSERRSHVLPPTCQKFSRALSSRPSAGFAVYPRIRQIFLFFLSSRLLSPYPAPYVSHGPDEPLSLSLPSSCAGDCPSICRLVVRFPIRPLDSATPLPSLAPSFSGTTVAGPGLLFGPPPLVLPRMVAALISPRHSCFSRCVFALHLFGVEGLPLWLLCCLPPGVPLLLFPLSTEFVGP